jgi:hypothetical protein
MRADQTRRAPGHLPVRSDVGAARARTRAELRRFAWVVGGALAAVAAGAWWRGRPGTALAVAGAAALLLAGGVAAPARLAPVERAWMRGALAISRVTTPLLMALVYLVVLTPLGLARRAFGRDPIAARRRGRPGAPAPTRWAERSPGARRSDLRRQF